MKVEKTFYILKIKKYCQDVADFYAKWPNLDTEEKDDDARQISHSNVMLRKRQRGKLF